MDNHMDYVRGVTRGGKPGLLKEINKILILELLRSEGLSVPTTTELIYDLDAAGWSLPLSALTVDECADAIAAALR